MSDRAENAVQKNAKKTITRGEYRALILWAGFLVLLYAVIGIIGISKLKTYKEETAVFRQEWMKTSRDGQEAAIEGAPVDVHAGIYMRRMSEFSIGNNRWTAEFDLWFRWRGETVDPGENFEITDGRIELREKKESTINEGEHYERYHVRASLLKYFDGLRFPFSDQGLVIQIQDGRDDARRLRYVAQKPEVLISPQAVPNLLKITQSGIWVKQQSDEGTGKVYSKLVCAVMVATPGPEVYIRMTQALFASIAVNFIVLFIRPIFVDPRFGLGIGAFFAVVGNNIFIQSLLPVTNSISLFDMASGIALITIFLTLAQSAISLYLYDTKGHEKMSNLFDKVSFAVLLPAYVIVNALLPLAASI